MPDTKEIARLKKRAKQNGKAIHEVLAGVAAPKRKERTGRRQPLGHLSKLTRETYSQRTVNGMTRRMRAQTFGQVR